MVSKQMKKTKEKAQKKKQSREAAAAEKASKQSAEAKTVTSDDTNKQERAKKRGEKIETAHKVLMNNSAATCVSQLTKKGKLRMITPINSKTAVEVKGKGAFSVVPPRRAEGMIQFTPSWICNQMVDEDKAQFMRFASKERAKKAGFDKVLNCKKPQRAYIAAATARVVNKVLQDATELALWNGRGAKTKISVSDFMQAARSTLAQCQFGHLAWTLPSTEVQ